MRMCNLQIPGADLVLSTCTCTVALLHNMNMTTL